MAAAAAGGGGGGRPAGGFPGGAGNPDDACGGSPTWDPRNGNFKWSGIFIINLGKTWEKLQLAARVIVAIENPQDIIVQSARPYGQRAVLKFAQYTGAHAIAGRHTPGTFTNQLQTSFSEPRLLILTDPRTDHQPIKESALETSPLLLSVTLILPCAMSTLMRGTILPGHKWDVMVDLFFYRDPEEAKEQEEEEAAVGPEYAAVAEYGAAPTDNWGDQQWGGEVQPPALPAAPTGEWGAAPAPVAAEGWDAVAVPPAAAAAVAPPAAPGWEEGSAPAPTGW
ncbi:hypothetical protein OsJ_11185 [Oryza sativa Japonica Group]|uniref:Small ribosomal subunit protein uS2 C-terminal domain-containing protein n=1 Tax=Oryza sativa subsp. japonica TaxID=39947 RepID=A3AIV8_ORYSJ|nr:hypothetical protein OsJ_11185 [Oryza sativa Japonica Group]